MRWMDLIQVDDSSSSLEPEQLVHRYPGTQVSKYLTLLPHQLRQPAPGVASLGRSVAGPVLFRPTN